MVLIGVVLVLTTSGSAVDVPPEERTADMPDSWLVLYNTNNPDSVIWANWYRQERNIPEGHMLGLAASLDEHLDTLEEVQEQIICPVRDLLDDDPELAAMIMGIIVGYGVPGHYAVPQQGPPGGYSVTDAFEETFDDEQPPVYQKGWNEEDNPQFNGGNMLPPNGRLTKASMEQDRFMVVRIDGPTLEDAMALTLRAKAIENPDHYLYEEYVWYDYTDEALPGNDIWQWLKWAVEEPELSEIPWTEFDADTEQTPNDAMRFGTHDVNGWDDERLYHPEAGSRILAFNYNSWGATTVRSTGGQGRYVPNALAAGYAAAIGATGEPGCCVGPVPETILAALREGWTLGESFHICAVYDDWMWTLVGDPFLTIPHWFDEPPPAGPGNGDMNGDGIVNGLDIPVFAGAFTGEIQDPVLVAIADLSGDGQLDDEDIFLFMAPILYGTYDWDVIKGSGDANGDGAVNGADIEAFMDMLFNGDEGYPLRGRWGADMNKDLEITLDDLPLFIQALSR